MRLVTDGRIDLESENFLRAVFGYFFDVHAALSGSNEGDAACGPIDERGEIELARDRRAFLDVKPADGPSFLAGLMRYERHTEHPPGFRANTLDGSDEFHAAAFPASACVNLGLHHEGWTAQFFGRSNGFLNSECGNTTRHWHPEAAQNFLGLVFVDVHGRFGCERLWPALLAAQSSRSNSQSIAKRERA